MLRRAGLTHKWTFEATEASPETSRSFRYGVTAKGPQSGGFYRMGG
ncbi:hypothetical protein SAMN05428984_1250 [Sphingomonas sp. OK281]|nr:hypothetical protein SAMN05428984_1250 [Sphingomonas sp. OK281]